jgi:hypothetical protein
MELGNTLAIDNNLMGKKTVKPFFLHTLQFRGQSYQEQETKNCAI